MKKLFQTLGLCFAAYTAEAQMFVPTQPQTKGILLEEFTACRCITCPNGHKIAYNIAKDYPDQLFIVNAHHGPLTNYKGLNSYTSNITSYIDYHLGPISAYPQALVNRTKTDDNIYFATPSLWNYYISKESRKTTPVNIAARCSIDIDTRVMKVHVQSYYTSNGNGTKDFLNVAILQNNIIGIQSNAIDNPLQYLDEDKYLHQHMLRMHLTPDLGQPLSPVTANTLHENHFLHTIPDKYGNSAGVYGMIDAVLEDLEVLAYITDSLHTVQQVVKADITFTSNKPNRIVFKPAQIRDEESLMCSNITHIDAKFKNIGTNPVRKIKGYYTTNDGLPTFFEQIFTTPLASDATGTFALNNIETNHTNNIINISIHEVNDIRITPMTQNITVQKALNVISQDLNANIEFTHDFVGYSINWALKDLNTNTIIHQVMGNRNLANQVINTPLTLIDGHCYEFTITDNDGQGFFANPAAGAKISIGNQEIINNADNHDFTGTYSFKFIINGERLVAIEKPNLDLNVQVYPNPNQGNLYLKWQNNEQDIYQIDIINTLGQVLIHEANYNSTIGENKLEFTLSTLQNGLYFVRIANENGQEILPFMLNK